jgi:RNA polymerase sigma factor (sigma-70 family)
MSDVAGRTRRGPGSPADDADRDVLDRIVAGQREALEELYDRYRTMAYSIALRITRDPTVAEDVVQDAFVGAWRNASRYISDRGTVRTWLLSIVHHRAIDALRRTRSSAELPGGDEPTPESMTLPDVWPEVAGRLLRLEILQALRALSDVQREALELAYFGGLTQQEIARRTGTPLGTVKSRMRLGLLAMRRALVGVGADGDLPESLRDARDESEGGPPDGDAAASGARSKPAMWADE